MALAEMLTEWARSRGDGVVELDPDGGIQLLLDDGMTVDIGPTDEDESFSMTAAVGPLPEDGRSAVMEELLMANLVGLGTGGASLAIDAVSDEIVLCRVFHTDDLSPEIFEREFDRFVEVLRFWRERHDAGQLGRGAASRRLADDGTSPEPAPDAPGLVRI